MFGFARELPEAKKHRLKDVDQVHAVSYIEEDDEILSGHLKHLPKAIWNILRNPTFVACMVVGIFESVVINGFAAFMPKILETILSTTPTIASYMSSLIILAAAIGVIVGGIVIRKMKLQVGGMLKLMVICHVIALITLGTFLLQCPPRTFVGINIDYNNQKLIDTDSPSSLDVDCNRDCDCTDEWNPVCHTETGASFYSACHAGCKTQISLNNSEKEWLGCKCLKRYLNNQTLSKNDERLSAGY
uniref:Kazal-like domain-containing protein n=1 Tax=Plectus sambesii TaxID=2011161 RepID=A0A914VB83_9BILA